MFEMEDRMKRKPLASFLAAMLLTFFSNGILLATGSTEEDTDNLIVQAKVVEVAESHISVMARSGVEHVIAVDREGTKVTIDGRVVSLKDVREGDIATIELDAQKPVKFARNISMRSEQSQVARVRR
jgi:multidrug resistance efflux pump